MVFQLEKRTVFKAFAASIRKSILVLSLERKVRLIDEFNVNWPGPLIEFRAAFPHFPAAGAVNAAGFK